MTHTFRIIFLFVLLYGQMRCSLSADSRLFYRLILGLPCDDIKMSLNHESRARVGAEPTNAPPPLVNVALACIDRIRSSCRARAYTQTPWHFHYSRSNAASLATRKHSNHFQYQYQPFSAQFVCFHFLFTRIARKFRCTRSSTAEFNRCRRRSPLQNWSKLNCSDSSVCLLRRQIQNIEPIHSAKL